MAHHGDGVIVVTRGFGVDGDDTALPPVVAVFQLRGCDGIGNALGFLQNLRGECIGQAELVHDGGYLHGFVLRPAQHLHDAPRCLSICNGVAFRFHHHNHARQQFCRGRGEQTHQLRARFAIARHHAVATGGFVGAYPSVAPAGKDFQHAHLDAGFGSLRAVLVAAVAGRSLQSHRYLHPVAIHGPVAAVGVHQQCPHIRPRAECLQLAG